MKIHKINIAGYSIFIKLILERHLQMKQMTQSNVWIKKYKNSVGKKIAWFVFSSKITAIKVLAFPGHVLHL